MMPDLATVKCKRCGQMGHFASQCPNKGVKKEDGQKVSHVQQEWDDDDSGESNDKSFKNLFVGAVRDQTNLRHVEQDLMIGLICYYEDKLEETKETVIFFEEDSDEEERLSTLFKEAQAEQNHHSIFCFKNVCGNAPESDNKSEMGEENEHLVLQVIQEATTGEDVGNVDRRQVDNVSGTDDEARARSIEAYLADMRERINPTQNLISQAHEDRAVHYATMFRLGNYHQLTEANLAKIEAMPDTLRNALNPGSTEEFYLPHNRTL